MTENKKPLWVLMRYAFRDAPDESMAACYGAEIRVIADELERRQLEDYAVVLPDVQEVVNWLRAEATIAENIT